MSLKKYFYIAFGSILTISIVLGVATIYTTRSLKVESDRLNYAHQQLRLLKRTKSLSNLMLKEVADYILLLDDYELNEFMQASKSLSEVLEAIGKTTDKELKYITFFKKDELSNEKEESDVVNRIINKAYSIINESQRIVATVQNGKIDEAVTLLKNGTRSAYNQDLRMLIDQQIQDEQREIDAVHASLNAAFDNFQLLGIVSLLLLILTVLFSTILIFRSIFNPINELVQAVKRIGSGDYSIEIQSREGEVGLLAESLKTMAKDLNNSQQQLVQSAKMASMGHLTSGIANEMHKPLNDISLNAKIMRMELSVLDECYGVKEAIKLIESDAHKLSETISHLNKFSRQTSADKHPLDINLPLLSSTKLLKRQFDTHNIILETDFQNDIPEILGNENGLEQVFVNMLTNSLDAVSSRYDLERGRITICSLFDESDNTVRIRFEDTGNGINNKILPLIFDPFFTTKGKDMRPGLGLSISYGILLDHDGLITVAETSTEGTTFELRIPAINSEAS